MSQKSRTLTLLRRAGREGVTTDRFLDERLSRFSARIFELRREGFFIKSQLLRNGSMRYTLVSEPGSVERDDSTAHDHTHATGEPGPPRLAASTPDAVVSLGAPRTDTQCLGGDDTPPTDGQVKARRAVVVPPASGVVRDANDPSEMTGIAGGSVSQSPGQLFDLEPPKPRNAIFGEAA